jgi:threonine dehydrogenase-like Zn-dependent dehydrogenase
VIEFAKQGKLNLKDMITKVLPLSEIGKAVEILEDKPKDMIKIVFNP